MLVFILCSLAIGCGSTKVFMGSYDSVKITVSGDHAQMSAENFPSEARLIDGILEKKIAGDSYVIQKDKSDNSFCEYSKHKHPLHVSIICSDENLIKEFSDDFYKSGFTIEKRFYKPYKASTIISKVTIYPKRKGSRNLEDEYHLIIFETMDELAGGTHRVLVKGPLAFIFWPMEIATNTKEVKMFITHSRDMKNSKFVVKDSTVIVPIILKLQVLSKTISTMKKPIKIIFTVT